MNAVMQKPLRDVAFGNVDVTMERRADGAILVTPRVHLPDYASSMCERLEYWAAAEPDKTFLAERDADGNWRRVSYAAALAAARSIGEALIARGLSAEKPLVILSGNDIDHGLLALGAMQAGIPYCPVSPAYSLISTDFSKLRHVFSLLTPGLVYVSDGARFAKALDAVWPAEREVIVGRNPVAGRRTTTFAELQATRPGAAIDYYRGAIGPDTIAKFLLTSGSTGGPKAVITTQRMCSSNQVMLREILAFLKDGPTIVDWLPWNHVFGGSHNFGLVLYNGGSLYIDDGKPVPEGIEATVRNLREVSPTVYFNVPKGYESLVPYLRDDRALRESFFRNLQALFFAGAGLPPHVWEALDELAIDTIGARIPILTGLGATESSPFSLCCTPATTGSGRVGVPVMGNLLKIVPVDGKMEARVKGPNITPGYWRQPDVTAKAFDEEGYYRFGDALRFVDEADIAKGFWFDGRITEDFKLSSGTWVSVGPMRARLVAACAPLVRDCVLAGPDRNELTAILIIDPQACRTLAGLPATATLTDIARHPAVRAALQTSLDRLAAEPGGSSTRVRRALVLESAPSIDTGEITDKGSINQRAVLAHRLAEVAALYADPPPPEVIVAHYEEP